MKKFFLILIIIVNLFTAYNVSAQTYDFSYENFISESKEYEIEGFNIEEDVTDNKNIINKFLHYIYNLIIKEIKYTSSVLCVIIIICMISSVLNSFIQSNDVSNVALYGSYVACSALLTVNFDNILLIASKSIEDICNYINVSFPGCIFLLSSSGYSMTATSMNAIFVIVSNVIAFVLNRYIVPILYFCLVLAISNIIADSEEINDFNKLIIKFIRYLLGIMFTVFGAVLSFTGFSSSVNDGIALKTAKYAISNFVPLVGTCLADTLNSVIYTSTIMKNTVGYICLWVVFMISIIPAVKLMVMSFTIKLTSISVSVMSHKKIASALDIVYEIISTLWGLIILLTIMCVVLFGIVVSVG